MEEQKKLSNFFDNQPVAATASKKISTAAGALIILIVSVIAGVGVFYFLQNDFSENSTVSDKSLKSQMETTATKENEIVSQTQVEEKADQSAAGAAFDFDYELKKLDDQNNAVSSDDFNENEMSDANIGL